VTHGTGTVAVLCATGEVKHSVALSLGKQLATARVSDYIAQDSLSARIAATGLAL
jgi:hypothetical protein